LAESGLPGYDISSWQAMYAPAGLPRDIAARLHAETVRILRMPENQKKLADLGLDAGGMAPEELGALMRAEIPRLGKVVKESGARVD
jgi:tripartite-type tricarboxylate transporter receptor subunit TctC